MNKIFLLALVLPLCAYSQELCNENGKSKALDEEVKQLKIDSFIGVPFGIAKSKIPGIHLLSYKDDETKKEVVFYRPFRNFKQGIVKFDKDSKLSNAVDTEFCYPPNKSKKDIINEVMTIKSIFEKKYGIEMMEGGIGFALYDHQPRVSLFLRMRLISYCTFRKDCMRELSVKMRLLMLCHLLLREPDQASVRSINRLHSSL